MLDRLDAASRRLSGAVAVGAGLVLLAVALSTTLDVLLRYLAVMPMRGHAELASLSTAIAVAAFFPALVSQRGNVTIKLVGQWLGRSADRWLNLFGSLCLLAFIAILAWQLVLYAVSMAEGGEVTPYLRLPVAPAWWAVVGSIAAALVAALVATLQDVAATWSR